MTNKEKARKIAKEFSHNYYEGCKTSNSEEECYESALEAMRLKDEEWVERFKKAFEGLWTASFNVDNLSSKAETTIEFKLVK